jgi:hypothetical protein
MAVSGWVNADTVSARRDEFRRRYRIFCRNLAIIGRSAADPICGFDRMPRYPFGTIVMPMTDALAARLGPAVAAILAASARLGDGMAMQKTTGARRKLPARYAVILTPLIISVFMSCIVACISTIRGYGLGTGFVTVWMQSWATSWVIAFPILVIVLPVVRRIVGVLVEQPGR